jgi:hypothetical protein
LYAADRHRAGRVAGVHDVLRRDPAYQLHQLGAADPHAVAVHIGARTLPHGRRLVVAEIDPDLFENAAGFVVDELDGLLGQDVVDRDPAHQRGEGG